MSRKFQATTNIMVAKFKAIANTKYLIGAQTIREPNPEMLTHEIFFKWPANFITGST